MFLSLPLPPLLPFSSPFFCFSLPLFLSLLSLSLLVRFLPWMGHGMGCHAVSLWNGTERFTSRLGSTTG